jgi:malate synthase
MRAPFMTFYSQWNIAVNNKRGGYAVGGMATAMPNPAHPEATPVALDAIRQDKRRERQMGYRWSWTATPAPDYVAAGQSELLKEDAEVERMPLPKIEYKPENRDRFFEYPKGEITEKGMRLAIYYASEYMAGQQEGNNAVAIEDPDTHIRHMNDFATFEIFWHWLWTLYHHGRMNQDVLDRLLREEQARKPHDSLRASIFDILKRLVTNPRMLPYGSHVLLAVVDEADEAKRNEIVDQILRTS